MSKNDFIDWMSEDKEIDNSAYFYDFEYKLNLKLPNEYKDLVLFRDGGTLKKDLFYYDYENSHWRNCVGDFLCWQPNDDADFYIIDDKKISKKFFRKGLEPITYEGNDNWLCFDYRFDQDPPPIIIYHRKIGQNEILDHVLNPPEFFPKGLIPFAPDGGGNYICFDYRKCKENPPIVFWHHEVEENEGVFYLSDSFDEFIDSLVSEDELEKQA
jgi:hypothetical protein